MCSTSARRPSPTVFRNMPLLQAGWGHSKQALRLPSCGLMISFAWPGAQTRPGSRCPRTPRAGASVSGGPTMPCSTMASSASATAARMTAAGPATWCTTRTVRHTPAVPSEGMSCEYAGVCDQRIPGRPLQRKGCCGCGYTSCCAPLSVHKLRDARLQRLPIPDLRLLTYLCAAWPCRRLRMAGPGLRAAGLGDAPGKTRRPRWHASLPAHLLSAAACSPDSQSASPSHQLEISAVASPSKVTNAGHQQHKGGCFTRVTGGDAAPRGQPAAAPAEQAAGAGIAAGSDAAVGGDAAEAKPSKPPPPEEVCPFQAPVQIAVQA